MSMKEAVPLPSHINKCICKSCNHHACFHSVFLFLFCHFFRTDHHVDLARASTIVQRYPKTVVPPPQMVLRRVGPTERMPFAPSCYFQQWKPQSKRKSWMAAGMMASERRCCCCLLRENRPSWKSYGLLPVRVGVAETVVAASFGATHAVQSDFPRAHSNHCFLQQWEKWRAAAAEMLEELARTPDPQELPSTTTVKV